MEVYQQAISTYCATDLKHRIREVRSLTIEEFRSCDWFVALPALCLRPLPGQRALPETLTIRSILTSIETIARLVDDMLFPLQLLPLGLN
jgi:hypothetical protein